MKKQALLFSAASLAFLAGCSDNSVTTGYESDKANAKITLSIVDGNSNEAIESAEVVGQFDKKTSYSDASGFVVFKKKDIGEYIFEISKEDYSTTRVVVPVRDNEGDKEVTRVPDVAVTVPLYKADVTVTGHVYYRDIKTGNLEPASKVDVVLSYDNASSFGYDFSDMNLSGMDADDLAALKNLMEGTSVKTSIYPSEVKVTTDSTGSYKFKNVAERVNFHINALQTKIDSKLYTGSRAVSASGLRSGSKTMDMLVLVADGESPALLKTNLKKVEQNSSLEFEFTTELNGDSLDGNWAVTKSGKKVLSTVSLSKDKKTVIVKPLSESWSKKTNYEVIGVVYSKDGMRLSVDENFSVGSVDAPKSVSDLKVSLDTTDYRDSYGQYDNFHYYANLALKWKAPSKGDVDDYNIYYKTNEMDDFEFFASSDTNFYNRSISSLSVLNDTNVVSITFVVLSHNIVGESDVAEAKKVTWKVPEIVEEEEDDDDDGDDDEEDEDEDEDLFDDGDDEDEDEDLFDDEDDE